MPVLPQMKESNGQVSVFRLAASMENKMVRTGKGRVTGTGYSKLDAQLHWPRDLTRCHQPKQLSWSWDESNMQHNWIWDETKSRQEARSWDTFKTQSIKGSVKFGTARGRRDSGTESEGDDHRASKHSPRQEAMVQPTTLPESWTVFLNASRQVCTVT